MDEHTTNEANGTIGGPHKLPVPRRGEDGKPVYDQDFFLTLARGGKDVWNHWRDINPDADVTFEGINFNESETENASINLIGFRLGPYANFRACRFGHAVNLSGATFGDGAKLSGATFGVGADLSGATFKRRANLSGATFGHRANFSGATFEGEADLSGAIFEHWANFSGVTFVYEAVQNPGRLTVMASFH
jgi:hypothetical protein